MAAPSLQIPGSLEVGDVLRDVVAPFGGHIRVREDRLHRTLGLARPAVDALIRVDEVLVVGLVDAVHGAHLDAARVLCADARLRDYVGHHSALFGSTPAGGPWQVGPRAAGPE